MKFSKFVFNGFGINTIIAWDPTTREAAVIDPGNCDAEETAALDSFIENNRLTITHLINTHMHLDHVMGVKHVIEKYDVKCEANPNDSFLGERCTEQARLFGLPQKFTNITIGKELHQGDIIRIGEGELKVLEVPGHSPGSIALYDEADNVVIVGDALFKGSIGRTDLAGGNYSTLIRSIKDKLLSLPDETVVIPGHGPETTIGYEKQHNPFIN